MTAMAAPGFPIVGIGASAGGIEALEGFFRGLPDRPGLGFVIVTHLSPERESRLHEVVGQLHGPAGRRSRPTACWSSRTRSMSCRPTPSSASSGGRLRMQRPNVGPARAQADRHLLQRARRRPGRGGGRRGALGRRRRRHARRQGDQGARRPDPGAGRRRPRAAASRTCRTAPSPPASWTSPCRPTRWARGWSSSPAACTCSTAWPTTSGDGRGGARAR